MNIKKIIFSITVLCLVSFSLSAQATISEYRNYDVNSGYIKYKLTGAQTGTQETYFFDWGKGEVKFTTGKMEAHGEKRDLNTTFISTTQSMLSFDRKTKAGVLFPQPDYSTFYEIWEEENGNFEAVQDRLVKMNGMTFLKEGYILGRKCKIWKQERDGRSMEIWSWKGIQLKIIQSVPGFSITQTAVEIKLGIENDKTLFEIPKDIKWTDGQGEPIDLKR